ncbi:NUDIX domain-containing protein [Streptacidiphilus sp. N1-3]|uniref:NUDIX domain-containing protein n=1 Tax=Streptacidiphilus alkalitolerans TaxID=3342712 RepID=A0ABV6XCP6_9ACTN
MSDAVPLDLEAYDRALPRKRMAAGVLFLDAGGRVLLVDPVYKETWDIPGGVVDADEAPGQAAVREVREELGLTLPLGPLLVVDWIPPSAGSSISVASEGLMMVFDGGILAADRVAAIVLQRAELRGWAFVGADQLHEFLHDRLTRRIRAALRARHAGTALYLENGFESGPA